ncbi:MAG: phosphate starvation-inducible protein PsiF [Bdellovibrionaceae bacterium]|nr:phosphate starvation-inducible protein PsiF [Pseudobdellovibrionaceae bacterium]
MKQILLVICVAFGMSQAFANPQQERMKTCNVEAKGKKGDERKEFMKSCLSGSTAVASAKPTTPQERMKECNKQATGKKGQERKTFMSSCLKAQ